MLAELMDPKWWFTAVVVAVLVNILSAYLKHPMDRIGRWLGETYRGHSTRAKKKWEARLELAKTSDRALLVETAREARYRASATFNVVVAFAVASLILYFYTLDIDLASMGRLLLLVVLISVFAAFINLIRAMDVHDLVLRAVERSLASNIDAKQDTEHDESRPN